MSCTTLGRVRCALESVAEGYECGESLHPSLGLLSEPGRGMDGLASYFRIGERIQYLFGIYWGISI